MKQPGKKRKLGATRAVDEEGMARQKQQEATDHAEPSTKKKAKRRLGDADICSAAPAAQAAWLRQGLAAPGQASAAACELDYLSEGAMLALPPETPLEVQLSHVSHAWADELKGRGLPNGSPVVLIVCPAAMDAVRRIRELPTLNKECRVAKLFAKHIKLEEQRTLLLARACGIACGTPHRLGKLADEGALSTERLRLLLIDLHVDAKQRTILDIPETRRDLLHLLSRHAAQRVAAGKTLVALFGA